MNADQKRKAQGVLAWVLVGVLSIRDHWAPDGLQRWSEIVLERLCAINVQFPEPLPFSEVRATAKSIARWTWTRITPGGLQKLIQRTRSPEQQAERGRKANHAAAGIASGNARRVSREPERATARLMLAVQGHVIQKLFSQ